MSKHLKDVAKLSQKKYRREEGLVVVEGERCLAQIAAAGVRPREVYLAPGAPETHPIVKLAERVVPLSANELNRLTHSLHPQPIAALFETTSPALPPHGRILYLDDIHDPGNLGAILRTAVALGWAGAVLSPDCCDPFNPKAVQSALGAPFFFAAQRHPRQWALDFPGTVIAADMHGTPLQDFTQPAGDVLLIIGSEAHGVCQELLARADVRLSIPLPGPMESLNAAVAAGILLHALCR